MAWQKRREKQVEVVSHVQVIQVEGKMMCHKRIAIAFDYFRVFLQCQSIIPLDSSRRREHRFSDTSKVNFLGIGGTFPPISLATVRGISMSQHGTVKNNRIKGNIVAGDDQRQRSTKRGPMGRGWIRKFSMIFPERGNRKRE